MRGSLAKPLLLLCMAWAASCSSRSTRLAVGQSPLRFEPHQVMELEIAKVDPAAGDSWAVRLSREAGSWSLRSGPHGDLLQDRRVDEDFVRHLLDSLRTLRIASVFNKDASLESTGLATPRYALRMKLAGQTTPPLELRVGSPAVDRSGTCASFPLLDPNGIYSVTGSALPILNELSEFRRLRARSWPAFRSDDVDEVTLFSRGKRLLYAQRDGARWTDEKHRPLARADAEELVSLSARAAIVAFIDEEERSQAARRALEKTPELELVYRSRDREAGRFRIARLKGFDGPVAGDTHGAPFRADPALPERLLRAAGAGR